MGNKFGSIKVETAFEIFGISNEHMIWRNRRYFVNSRMESGIVAVSLCPNPKGGCVISDGRAGPRCLFTADKTWRTVFINRSVAKGIFRWSIQVTYDKRGDCYSQFGTCSFLFTKFSNQLQCWLEGVDHPPGVNPFEDLLPDGSPISIEVECAQQTLSVFVCNAKVPHVITAVPVPLFLGVSGFSLNRRSSFVSLSFCRLLSATSSSSLICRMHKVWLIRK